MIAAGLFALLIIVGLITMQKPVLRYKLTEKETLVVANSADDQLSPDKAKEILKAKNPGFRFIDIRAPYEFIDSHIDGAVNIPLSNLFSEENYKFLKQVDAENKTLVLYGIDQSQANAPWMLLKQLGITKVLILQGGYLYYTGEQSVKTDSITKNRYDAEIARYNFAEMVKGLSKSDQEAGTKTNPQKVITTPKPKSTAPAAGGC